MKKFSVLFLLFVFSWSYAQDVNQYKYALVPSKYEFLKTADQYQLNSLTEFLMQKQGFDAFLDTDEMPEEMLLSNCNKIYVEVLSSGNFMSTKLTVVLKDCKSNTLFTSKEGKSKIKDFKGAYQEALRIAFQSFSELHYSYKPLNENSNPVASTATTATITKQEVGKPATVVAPVVTAPVVVAPVVFAPVVATVSVVANEVKPIAAQTVKITDENLFAQPIENGYQLIDKTPKVIMKIYNTSVKNVYSARVGDLQGVFLSKNNEWFFEYYQDDKLISQKINVKL